MNFEPLAEKVRYFKENEVGRGSMCRIVEDLRNEAIAETKAEERNAIANKLLAETELSVEAIAKATNLTIEEVENLKKNLGSDN